MTGRSTSGDNPRLSRLSGICLALPEVVRELSGSHATFRVKGKTFGYFLDDHHGDGIVAVAVRALPGENTAWIAQDPKRFYLPAYVGPRGWVGFRLDVGRPDWALVTDLVHDSYRLAAPKRLGGLVPRHR